MLGIIAIFNILPLFLHLVFVLPSLQELHNEK